MNVFLVAGNRLQELSLTRTTHSYSSVREMRTPSLLPTAHPVPWQRRQGDWRQCCCPVTTCVCQALGNGGISASPCCEGATARTSLWPSHIPFSCHSPVVALRQLPKMGGLDWLLSSHFVSKHRPKTNWPKKCVWGGRAAPWEAPPWFGCISSAAARSRSPFERLDLAISDTLCTQRQAGMKLMSPGSLQLKEARVFITSSKLAWYLTHYSRQWGLYYGLSLSQWPMSSHNFHAAVFNIYLLFCAVCIKELFLLFLLCACTTPCMMASGPWGRP